MVWIWLEIRSFHTFETKNKEQALQKKKEESESSGRSEDFCSLQAEHFQMNLLELFWINFGEYEFVIGF